MPVLSSIPVYKLYGEHEAWSSADLLHCETISSRSQLHNWRIKSHQHHGLFQLLYLKRGGAGLRLDGQARRMRAGEILSVPQMCVHGFEFEPASEGYVLTLAYSLLQQLGQAAVARETAQVWKLGAGQEGACVRMAFDALAAECRGSALHRPAMLEALLTVILVWLARQPGHSDTHGKVEASRAERHLAHFYRLIEEDYPRQHEVSHYAGRIGIGSAHLNALCRTATRRSALQLIHERLLQEARRSLVYGVLPVSQIALALGFSDPAYFTRFFKRATGMAPRDFRNQARKVFEQEIVK